MQPSVNPISHLTGGRLLARNVVWNLLGNAAPMFVAVLCIPPLIRGLGTDRFGILALTWALIGYAGLFDLGLGRALTKLVAEKLGTRQEHEIPVLFWTSLSLILCLGLAGGLIVVVASPWLIQHLLRIPGGRQLDTLHSFYLLGTSIPIVLATAGLRGFLEAHQRFGLINALRVPMGVFTFAGPMLVLPFTKNLFSVVAVLAAGRLVALLAHLLVCFRAEPALLRTVAVRRAVVAPLLSFGGWMTVSNIVGPLMVYLDRFLIGALISATAIAYYATPYEVVTKLWIIPGAVVGVLFPAFSSTHVQDQNRTAVLFEQGVKYVFLSLFPVILLTVALAQGGLRLWLGSGFALHSTRPLQWLAVGVFINSLAQVAFAQVQAVGRPDLTAKLHVLELPFYLFALWYLTHRYGVDGTATAWVLRVAMDALFLFLLSKRLLPGIEAAVRRLAISLITAVVILGLATLPMTISSKLLFVSIVLFAFAVAAWFLAIRRHERAILQGNSEESSFAE